MTLALKRETVCLPTDFDSSIPLELDTLHPPPPPTFQFCFPVKLIFAANKVTSLDTILQEMSEVNVLKGQSDLSFQESVWSCCPRQPSDSDWNLFHKEDIQAIG